MTLLLLGGGLLGIIAGLRLVAPALTRLRRAGVFGSLFWASFRGQARYRARALRPLPRLVAGTILLGAGAAALVAGVNRYYLDHLGRQLP
ncbi:MAG: hypothetical protein ACYDGR_02000 [Candidatus Dormibacteria bacterium]